jgi:hypothetical protein
VRKATKFKEEDHQERDDQGGRGEGGKAHVKNTHEQSVKERFKFNFQTRNQTRLCDSKIKT